MKPLTTGVAGILATGVTEVVVPQTDQIVAVAVQLIIGVVTLWKLIKKPKNN